MTDPTGGKVTTSYDEVGRTTSTKDANGNTTCYTYDGVGNTTKVTWMPSLTALLTNTMKMAT